MTEGKEPTQLSTIIAAALRDPAMILGAGITVLLFLSMAFIPVFGVVLGTFTPAPVAVQYLRRGRVFGGTLIGLSGLMVLLVQLTVGHFAGMLVFGEYVLLAVVLAECVARRLPTERIVGYPAAAALILAVIVLTVGGISEGRSPWSYTEDMVKAQVGASMQLYERILDEPAPAETPVPGSPTGDTDVGGPAGSATSDWTTKVVRLLVGVFPGMMVMGALLVAWANFLVVRYMVDRGGRRGLTPDLQRWRAPEPMVWLVIASGFTMFLPLNGPGLIGLNGLLILGLVYFFQGLSILSYWMDKKNMPTFFRVFVYVLIALQQGLALIVAALGLFDMWFDFRKLRKAA